MGPEPAQELSGGPRWVLGGDAPPVWLPGTEDLAAWETRLQALRREIGQELDSKYRVLAWIWFLLGNALAWTGLVAPVSLPGLPPAVSVLVQVLLPSASIFVGLLYYFRPRWWRHFGQRNEVAIRRLFRGDQTPAEVRPRVLDEIDSYDREISTLDSVTVVATLALVFGVLFAVGGVALGIWAWASATQVGRPSVPTAQLDVIFAAVVALATLAFIAQYLLEEVRHRGFSYRLVRYRTELYALQSRFSSQV
jgi:hypothetical protein